MSTAPEPHLVWREAKFRDRLKLRTWCCTWRKVQIGGTDRWEWPNPWEARVQTMFREAEPPVRGGQTLWLGLDDIGVAAAAIWRQEPPLVDGFFTLEAAAVASRHRGQGRVVSNMLLNEVLANLEGRAKAAGATELRIAAVVHRLNWASERICREAGFQCLGDAYDAGPEYQDWLYVRALGA